MVAGVYVTGETIRQKIILQNAVDAAAAAGAAVQADTLGRIDTLNRALAWTYIQANKMEMDHTVRNWANLNRQTLNNASTLLPVLNQNLSLTCVHATPHQSPRASNTVSVCLPAADTEFDRTVQTAAYRLICAPETVIV